MSRGPLRGPLFFWELRWGGVKRHGSFGVSLRLHFLETDWRAARDTGVLSGSEAVSLRLSLPRLTRAPSSHKGRPWIQGGLRMGRLSAAKVHFSTVPGPGWGLGGGADPDQDGASCCGGKGQDGLDPVEVPSGRLPGPHTIYLEPHRAARAGCP